MGNYVLVVDDDEAILEAVKLVFKDEGYAVESTSDIHLADLIKDKLAPSFILMDILLAGGDGREICKTLKSNEETKDIPVILMSAFPGVEKEAKDAGADGFLSKPFEIDDLLVLAKKYLSTKLSSQNSS